ncbi:hypothetical protein [Mesorhizobium sp. M1406]|uniref:hypothetical protein n=1 Tax=Mesorhizobium sp. M1406 TaxID=2957099 RepID=UPI00333A3E09
MGKSLFLAAGLIISAVSTSDAITLKDCSQFSQEKKVACLGDNVISLNDELDRVSKAPPNLGNVVIQWADHSNSCLTYLGNNLIQVVDTCTDPNRNRFVVRPFN